MNNKIDILREQLHKLVDSNATFEQIYEMSRRLDVQVTKFYRKTAINKYNKGKKYAV